MQMQRSCACVIFRRWSGAFVISSAKLPSTSCCSRLIPSRCIRTTNVYHISSPRDFPDISDIVKPVVIRGRKSKTEELETEGVVAEELTGTRAIRARDINRVLAEFSGRKQVRGTADEKGISGKVFRMSFVSFRNYCLTSKPLPTELHVVLHDVVSGKRSPDALISFFVAHAHQVFPHLKCYDELRRTSDVTEPQNWFPEARRRMRKIIFHCGPTNSGKTYAAMRHFIEAESAVYCAPLRLLAVENFHKLREMGIPADLSTGEEHVYFREDGQPSSHISCTVEKLDTQKPYDVCVIDEVQLLADMQRGFAWTRAILGANAGEVHLCGEQSALDIVENLLLPMGEIVVSKRYNRLTEPILFDKPVETFENVLPGDCIVCFSKADIYRVSKAVEEATGIPVAVIYGTLPPGAKVKQADRFNDPSDPCKVLVATDAIGMGVNLNIKRIIFHGLSKPTLVDGETGEKDRLDITPAHCKQIAGRAGRFGTSNTQGYVTTFRSVDFPRLKHLFEAPVEPIERAGLQVTAETIETFSYLLPDATLTNLIDIFYRIKDVDLDKYFMCATFDLRGNAEAIDHIRLPIVTKFRIALTPISVTRSTYLCTQFVSMVRAFASGEQVTAGAVLAGCRVSLRDEPKSLRDLSLYEDTVDILDMYLWLALRFPDVFVEPELVREAHSLLDDLIFQGLVKLCSSRPTSFSKVHKSAKKLIDEKKKLGFPLSDTT